MGVRGLHGFISDRKREYLFCREDLYGKRLVIDGKNLMHKLYYYSQAETAYGGEYDAFARCVDCLLTRFSEAKVELYVVFDGPTEDSTDLEDLKNWVTRERTERRIHLVNPIQQGAKIKPLLTLSVRSITCSLPFF